MSRYRLSALLVAAIAISSVSQAQQGAGPAAVRARELSSAQMLAQMLARALAPATIASAPVAVHEPPPPFMTEEELERLREVELAPGVGGGREVRDASVNAPDGMRPGRPGDAATAAAVGPTLGRNFLGVTNTGWYPPDECCAAGDEYVVEVVNSSIRITDKSGNQRYSATLGSFFSSLSPPSFIFDPKVYFDRAQKRFVVLLQAGNPNDTIARQSFYLVAASKSVDPTAGWWMYSFDATLDGAAAAVNWADHPRLGYDSLAIYISSNQYMFLSPFNFKYSKLRILDKSKIYSGAAVTWFDFWNQTNGDASGVFNWSPARSEGTTATEFMVNTLYGSNKTSVTLWAITNPLGNPPTLTRRPAVTVGSYTFSPAAAQSGGCANLDDGDLRVQDAYWQAGFLYTAFSEGHNFGGGTVSAIRLLKITTGTNTAARDLTYGQDLFHFFYPEMCPDTAGNAYVIFQRSSTTEFVNTRAACEPWTTPASTLVKAGVACYQIDPNRNRYGDYTGIAPDPDGTVWAVGEHSQGASSWATWLTALSLPGTPNPPSLIKSIATDTLVRVRWNDNSTDEAGFIIERRKPTFAWSTVVRGAANDTATTDTTALVNNFYQYHVRSSNGFGYSDAGGLDSAITMMAPTVLTTTPLTASRTDLSWNDNATLETAYSVERRDGLAGAWSVIATPAAQARTYSDVAAVTNARQYYRVRATALPHTSGYSAIVPAFPAAPATMMLSPITANAMGIGWSDMSTNEMSFRIERRDSATGAFATVRIVAANSTSTLDTSVLDGRRYAYRVFAVNPAGDSDPSNIDSSDTPLRAPGALTAVATSSDAIALAWGDSSQSELMYAIERQLPSSSTFVVADSTPTNVVTYVDAHLGEGTPQTYRVHAVNAIASSLPSATASATTYLKSPAPLRSTSIGSSRIALAWTDSSSKETGYALERRAEPFATAVIDTLPANIAAFADTGLVEGTLYAYRLSAFNATAASLPATDTAATLLNRPGHPHAQAIAGSIRVDWIDSSQRETQYVIERRTSPSGTFSPVGAVATNGQLFIDSPVSEGTTCQYRVQAKNSRSVSAYSDTVSATVHLLAATSVGATALSGQAVAVAWIPVSAVATGTRVLRDSAADPTWRAVADLTRSASSFTDTTCGEATRYQYRILGTHATVPGDTSAAAAATTLLNEPTGLAAMPASRSDVALAWADNSAKEDQYEVERITPPSPAFALLRVLGASATGMIDTALVPGVTYRYRVRATSAADSSLWSEEADATTDAVRDARAGAPARITLHAPSPNPASVVARFSIDVASPCRVSLFICNERGEEITRILDAAHVATGTRDLEWNPDPRAVPSGAYFARLIAVEDAAPDEVVVETVKVVVAR
jgi:hypothetical protein